MGLSFEKLEMIKDDFEEIYFFSPPYNKYVNSCVISNLDVMKRLKKSFILKEGESLDDFCLDVTFREKPPTDLKFPEEYMKVRVFYEVIGELMIFAK